MNQGDKTLNKNATIWNNFLFFILRTWKQTKLQAKQLFFIQINNSITKINISFA